MRAGLWIVLSLFSVFTGIGQDLRLPGVFSSQMIMQRDTVISVWGWGSPGSRIRVLLSDQMLITQTDMDGRFEVQMGPFSAGGPHLLTVKSDKESIVLDSIFFGEVWLCGGQSNMQFTIDMLKLNPKEATGSKSRQIHFLNVEVETDLIPAGDIAGGSWQVANEQTIGNLSGTAYFFARYLYDSLQVPIGLISSNLGATSIETWMSARALDTIAAFGETVRKTEGSLKSKAVLLEELATFRAGWDSSYYLNETGINEKWYMPDLDVSDWEEVQFPYLWEDHGYPEHDGFGWFRLEFDKPDMVEGMYWQLSLNQIAAYDIAWLNGEWIGESFGGRNWRNYQVLAPLLREKGNVLVVRVFDAGGKGGFYSSTFWGGPLLHSKWKFKLSDAVSMSKFPLPKVPDMSFFTHPTSLYNANIAPLSKYRIRGAIWYQGESNESRAVEYSNLLKTLVRDWRKTWKQGDFPFIVVQLANYRKVPENPGPSKWAEIREAQMDILTVSNTAVATAIDIGDAEDIHPRNKETLGHRLALNAMKLAYGMPVSGMGPIYSSVSFKNGMAIVEFNNAGKKLVSKQKNMSLNGFELAAEDGIFYFADARLDNGKVIINCPKVPDPKYVRYAWADNPGPLDLYDEAGMPAFPFRTDDFRLSTADKFFIFDPYGF